MCWSARDGTTCRGPPGARPGATASDGLPARRHQPALAVNADGPPGSARCATAGASGSRCQPTWPASPAEALGAARRLLWLQFVVSQTPSMPRACPWACAPWSQGQRPRRYTDYVVGPGGRGLRQRRRAPSAVGPLGRARRRHAGHRAEAGHPRGDRLCPARGRPLRRSAGAQPATAGRCAKRLRLRHGQAPRRPHQQPGAKRLRAGRACAGAGLAATAPGAGPGLAGQRHRAGHLVPARRARA
jgi:hypothetical protein